MEGSEHSEVSMQMGLAADSWIHNSCHGYSKEGQLGEALAILRWVWKGFVQMCIFEGGG